MTKKMEVEVVVIDMSMLAVRKYKDFMGTFIADLVLAFLCCGKQEEKHIKTAVERHMGGEAERRPRH